MEIEQLFKTEIGEIRLVVEAKNALDAKTLYTLCKIGIQAGLYGVLKEVEEDFGI